MILKIKSLLKLSSAIMVPVVQAGQITVDRRKHSVMAAERNKQPILDILCKYVDRRSQLFALEIASGTGQHVSFFAKTFTNVTWQPTEVEPSLLDSIDAYIDESKSNNILRPKNVDITKPVSSWTNCNLKPASCDIVLCINMIHISPFACTVGLFEAAGYLLKSKGTLITYGPYSMHGVLVPESNVQFDKHLKAMNSQFGIRDVDDLTKLARENELRLEAVEDMPANNKTLIFRKR